MATTAACEVKNGCVPEAMRDLLRKLLSSGAVDALLAPIRGAGADPVMPTLVTDPEALSGADPLAPCAPLSAARLAARLARGASGRKLAALLRPCEVRAFIELCKLNQAERGNLALISFDCPGVFGNRDYARFAEKHGENASRVFLDSAASGLTPAVDGIPLASSCLACEHPEAEAADLSLGFMGAKAGLLYVAARSEAGEALMEGLSLSPAPDDAGRKEAMEGLIAARTRERDRMFAETAETVGSLDRLSAFFAGCVNCYNCRAACPVCYCRECVFLTDAFDHEPAQYLRWSEKKGAFRMPADTLFFHLTRLTHMSTSCVGCGQCENACPNDIPMARIFRLTAARTQAAFDYEAGRSADEPLPLSQYGPEEFTEVVGIH